MRCCVPFCEQVSKQSSKNYHSKTDSEWHIAFFEFPTIRWLKSLWLESIGIHESQLPTQGGVVCSHHFQTDDLYVTKSGIVKLRVNSVPSVFKCSSTEGQFCVLCLDASTSKMYPLEKYLAKIYNNMTGLDCFKLKDHCLGSTEPKLCVECAQRLINYNKFRDKSLNAHNLLMQLHKKHGKLSLQKIKTIDREDCQVTSNLAKHIIEPDHCDFYLKDQRENQNVKPNLHTEVDIENADPISDTKIKEKYLDTDVESITEYLSENDDISSNSEVKVKNDKLNAHMYRKCYDIIGDKDINIDAVVYTNNDNCETNNDETINDEDSDDDDTASLDDFDSYLKFVNNNVVTNKDTVVNNTEYRPKKVAANKKKVSLKNVILIKDSKDKVVNKDIANQKEVTLNKNATNIGELNTKKIPKMHVPRPRNPLKLFTVTSLSYEEQLADVNKRKHTDIYLKFSHKCTICYKGYWVKTHYVRHMEKHTDKYGLLECAVCGLHSKTRNTLITHLKLFHNVRYSCKGCSFVTNNKKLAQVHEQWHDGRKYKCQQCDAEFQKRSAYLFHMRSKHPSNIVCVLCGNSFVSDSGLRLHMTIKHRSEDAQDLAGPECWKCDIRFASVAAYERHLNVSPKHSIGAIVSPKPPTPAARPPPPKRSRRAVVMCELCGKVCRDSSKLRLHIQTHTGERNYECDTCRKRFTQRTALVIHLETHKRHPARFRCGVCGKDFATYSSRWRHMLIHSDARPSYECQVCHKSFTSNEMRKAHELHVHRKVPRPKTIPRPAGQSAQTRRAKDRHELEKESTCIGRYSGPRRSAV